MRVTNDIDLVKLDELDGVLELMKRVSIGRKCKADTDPKIQKEAVQEGPAIRFINKERPPYRLA